MLQCNSWCAGGRFLCLEFSHVNNAVLRNLYDQYSFGVIPVLGQIVAGDRQSYQVTFPNTSKEFPHPPPSSPSLQLTGAVFGRKYPALSRPKRVCRSVCSPVSGIDMLFFEPRVTGFRYDSRRWVQESHAYKFNVWRSSNSFGVQTVNDSE